mgnify:CR=1 FL=1
MKVSKFLKVSSMSVFILFLSCISMSQSKNEAKDSSIVTIDINEKEEDLKRWERMNEVGIEILRMADERIKERRTRKFVIDITGEPREVIIHPGEQHLLDRNKVPKKYHLFIIKLSRYYNIDSHVFISLVQIESNWGRAEGYNEVGDRGRGPNKEWADIGLGQLNSRYHDEFAKKNFDRQLLLTLGYKVEEFDATDGIMNLQVTSSIIHERFHVFGNYDEGLMAYNAGTYAVANDFPGFDQTGRDKVAIYAYSIINNRMFLVESI